MFLPSGNTKRNGIVDKMCKVYKSHRLEVTGHTIKCNIGKARFFFDKVELLNINPGKKQYECGKNKEDLECGTVSEYQMLQTKGKIPQNILCVVNP